MEPLALTYRGNAVTELPKEKGCKWHVGCVKSGMAKRFAVELADMGISYFLPMSHEEVLLYPGYIFLHLNWQDWYLAKRNRRMWNLILPPRGARKFLREDLQRILYATSFVNLQPVRLEDFTPGRLVRVKSSHPLSELGELVVNARQSNKVYVAGRGLLGVAEFSIGADLLELV